MTTFIIGSIIGILLGIMLSMIYSICIDLKRMKYFHESMSNTLSSMNYHIIRIANVLEKPDVYRENK